jgi:hypothetical protein
MISNHLESTTSVTKSLLVRRVGTVVRCCHKVPPMGCGSSQFEEVYPEEWITQFESLQLTRKDLVRLERVVSLSQ